MSVKSTYGAGDGFVHAPKMAASNAMKSISTIGDCEQAFKGFTNWGKGTTILTGK